MSRQRYNGYTLKDGDKIIEGEIGIWYLCIRHINQCSYWGGSSSRSRCRFTSQRDMLDQIKGGLCHFGEAEGFVPILKTSELIKER